MEGAIQPAFTQFNNSPIIIKDKYQISGSDAAQLVGLKLLLKTVLQDTYGI